MENWCPGFTAPGAWPFDLRSEINVPNPRELKVMERVLDIYDNTTHAYLLDGDGVLDADNDSINWGIAP